MAADRGAFIDQSQSLNVFMEVPTRAKVTSMHFYGWKKGYRYDSTNHNIQKEGYKN